MITAAQVKELRDETGVSIMQCRNALEAADGDMDKAREALKKDSKRQADKKKDRQLGSGAVAAYIHNDGLSGTIVELLCETDFVSRNDEFRTLARDIAMHITAMAPESKEELLKQDFIKDPSKTIGTLIDEAVQKFGEKTDVGEFSRFALR